MSDPVKRLVLLATWTDLQEEIITDNEIHSDLDPLEAPAWSVGVQFEDRPQCLMSKLSRRYLDLNYWHFQMYIWEHATRVFLPQPKKLDLEITGLVSKKISSHSHPRSTKLPPSLQVCLNRQRLLVGAPTSIYRSFSHIFSNHSQVISIIGYLLYLRYFSSIFNFIKLLSIILLLSYIKALSTLFPAFTYSRPKQVLGFENR